MRKLITEFLSSSEELEVVGTARNGEDALVKIKKLHPDVVTLDVEMPIMNGIDALKKIMIEYPLPVVMLSSTTKEGTEETVKAIQLGAVDFVAKPSGTISLDLHIIQEEIVRKVLSASGVSVAKLVDRQHSLASGPSRKFIEVEATTKGGNFQGQGDRASRFIDNKKKKIILIGTSTGGPRALQHVLTELPSNIQAPVLIVQHMPAGFTKSLATRLNSLCDVTVKEAAHGEQLENGTAYIAPGGFHMRIAETKESASVILSKDEDPRNGHRPSVDVLFESVSTIRDYNMIAVIMTGMGSDGARGLAKLKESGHVKVIAESQETCIVYGMPKAVVNANLADKVVNVEEIAQSIMNYMV
ncbi:protein-glutamate methylesterase/protein-glutamine glutaminase [Rossellomorea aquimaris]|uniref:protein-glutamate methylesterase/protein-glutamine glutaminase n=1 Tax=Rossellomorea aquimaris TaxID=189382 RepID=UPI00399093F2